jgi:hypothetical protein
MDLELQGARVLGTGGSKGIGLADVNDRGVRALPLCGPTTPTQVRPQVQIVRVDPHASLDVTQLNAVMGLRKATRG